MYMSRNEALQPTIRLREGVCERLKKEFGVQSDAALAAHLGLDQGHFSRIRRHEADPGPRFTGTLLRAVEPNELDWYDLFEVYPPAS